MVRRILILCSMAAFLVTTGCFKETYDMDRLSGKAHWSPSFGVSAVRGKISLLDIKEIPNDTVVFDEDGFIRIIIKEDSVLEFGLEDYFDLEDMVSFSKSYAIGEIDLAPFSGSVFPLTTTGELPFPVFANFESATLSQGALDIVVRNNTGVTITNITITIYNVSPHTPLGAPAVISAINSGQTGTATINLADLTIIKNNTAAGFVITAGGGLVLNGSNLQIQMTGRDMKVKSGRVKIAPQSLPALDNDDTDTVDFDPGEDIKIDSIVMNTGYISYTINNGTPLQSTVSLTLPTSIRGTNPITQSFVINPTASKVDSFSIGDSKISLGSVAAQPYNKLPVQYQILISSQNNMVTFNSEDEISIDLSMKNPKFDHIKGYFGKQTETIDKDTADLEIKDILDRILDDFYLTNPSVTLKYRNSFSVPIKIDLQATGYREGKTPVFLDLDPFILDYPHFPAKRDIDALFKVDSANSNLAGLVSMLPEKIVFEGGAEMNPGPGESMNNYIFGDSRFIGDLEIEVPMEFRIKNIQFTDTVDNFIKNDDPDEDSPIRVEDFEYLRVDLEVENGFPLGILVSMSLYNSATGDTICPVNAKEILAAAPVGEDGKTKPVTSRTSITITDRFWSSVNEADMIIFSFALHTTDNGTKDVKIYSNYGIDFKASLVLKPNLKFNLK
ncbi:MAG: hypothetical protein MUF36_05750 [Bacteroidales bacterium]|jgi:hypothetical protein|nr:hypothetical protein [Bacteroidales bacterium]